jgi:hypothetical protein
LIEANLIPGAFPFGSCIIVITREESVARHCATSADAVCRVRGLEADAARHLFQVCVSSTCCFMLTMILLVKYCYTLSRWLLQSHTPNEYLFLGI